MMSQYNSGLTWSCVCKWCMPAKKHVISQIRCQLPIWNYSWRVSNMSLESGLILSWTSSMMAGEAPWSTLYAGWAIWICDVSGRHWKYDVWPRIRMVCWTMLESICGWYNEWTNFEFAMHPLLEVPPSSAILPSGTATGNVQVESVRTWCRYRMVTSTSSIPIALWNPERDTMFIQLLHPMLQFAWLIDYSSLMGCQCEPYNLHSGTPTHGHSIVNRCTHKVRTQVCQCRRCAWTHFELNIHEAHTCKSNIAQLPYSNPTCSVLAIDFP